MQPPYQQPPYPPYRPYPQQNQQPYQQIPYQPQPKKRTYKSEILGMFIVIGVLILALVIAVVISGVGLSPIQKMLPATCTVGIVGANATVTFSGVGAETQCHQAVTNPNNKVSWYELQGVQPSGNVMCEGTLQGDTIIVRDQGILNIYGNELCSSFLKAGMTPTS